MNCEAPICVNDKNPNYKKEVLWYAGEPVCTCQKTAKFKTKQRDINKWVALKKFKNLDIPYTAFELETRSI